MAKIYQFPQLQTTELRPCGTCRLWSRNATELKKLYEHYVLYVVTSDDHLVDSIIHASLNNEPNPLKVAAAWQLGSTHYNDHKLRTILKSTFQNLSQIRFMLMHRLSTADEKISTAKRNISKPLTDGYGLPKMRAYKIFKKICLASFNCESDECWIDKKISYSSFTEALLTHLIQDGLIKGSILK
ncbi:hypothetical protein QCL51_07155 [Pseudomonas sp. LTR0]|uniref:hypothetical protein n=1 Tax=Pseudomonas sp. LTR0 TaxID=3040601 RepID=UPI0030D5E671